MARHLRAALIQVKAQLHGQLPVDVDQLAQQVGHRWRNNKLTPAVTVWLFLLQILNGNMAMTGLRLLGGVAMQASSYCDARMPSAAGAVRAVVRRGVSADSARRAAVERVAAERQARAAGGRDELLDAGHAGAAEALRLSSGAA